MTLRKFLLLLTTAGAITAMTSDIARCSGTGPDLNNPETVWDWCMQETTKWEVWHDKQPPELAVLTAYRTCRPDFKMLLDSLPSDAARSAYRAKVKIENGSRIAFGIEMLELGDPAVTIPDDSSKEDNASAPKVETSIVGEADKQNLIPLSPSNSQSAPVAKQINNPDVLPVREKNMCSVYHGKAIATQNFQTVIEAVSPAALKKDDYETQADFKKRQYQSAAGISSQFIVAGNFDSDWAKYDPEAHTLSIFSLGFSNGHGDYSGVTLPDNSSIESPYDVVIKRLLTEEGSYAATNAFGVSVQVQKVTVQDYTIFDHSDGNISDNSIFGNTGTTSSKPIGKIDLEPELAKNLKPNLRSAYLIYPKSPYYLSGAGRTDKPTVDWPIDRQWKVDAVVADIKCVFLTDANDMVIAEFETK